jgi:N-acetylglucosamine-6-phosphate deacetylase
MSAKDAAQPQDVANPSLVMKTFSIGAERTLINGEITSASIEIRDGFISAIEIAPTELTGDLLLTEGVLSPGFIDCQINGVGDINFFDGDKEGTERALAQLARHGVTACTPSMISAPIGELVAAIFAGDCGESRTARARHLGYHIEGPFLTDTFSRAHDAKYFLDPTPKNLAPLIETGRIAIVTLAPERCGALDAITTLREAGVVASVGHSAASYDEMANAVTAGLSMVTHLFNGMDKNVDEGIIKAARAFPELTIGLIADGIHNDSERIRWAFSQLSDRIALVTDSLGPTLGDAPVHRQGGDGGAYRSDGTLAGSTLTLDRVIARAVSYGVPITQALLSATRVAARLLGREDLGEIRVGARADLTLFTEGGSIRTWIDGLEVT